MFLEMQSQNSRYVALPSLTALVDVAEEEAEVEKQMASCFLLEQWILSQLSFMRVCPP
jgi:hypothetical protein